MFKKTNFFLILISILTIHLSAIPIGEVIVIDIPWVLDATDDGSVVVGGAEGGGGAYWTEETGVVIISATSEGSAISENGIIAGEEIDPDGYEAACWWDINILEPNFIGSVAGSTPMGNDINGANAISDDATTIVGLHWYNLGMGTAKAYKWTEETGCVLLPDVMDYSDSRADCVSADGSLIGGYAAEERSIWRPVLWSETEIIPLPYVHNESSVVKGISLNGEWCAGHNGNKGAIWHNLELVTLEGPDPTFIHTQFRTITEDGWAGGESANWNNMVSEPILWNPEDSLMNAVDFFNSLGVIIPDDFNIIRIRKMSNDHLIFVGNGYNTATYWNYGFIVKIPGPHSVSNFTAELEEYNNVHLTWDFDENTPGAQNVIILKDGVEIVQLDHLTTEYFDNDLDAGSYQYEVYVTYDEYDDSVLRTVDVEIILNTPTNLTAEVIDFDVQLNWDQPLDLRNLSGYKIYRDEEEIAFTSETQYLDSSLEPGTYNYYVTAIFSDLYESEPSNEIEVIVETGNAADENEIAGIDRLCGNYPNPFNPETTISFNIKENKNVVLEVFNTKGQKIKTLVNRNLQAGNHMVVWNGKNEKDIEVSSGLYFYKIKSGNYISVKKMIMMK